MNRPRLLILSFSPIESDARVLKQISAFTDDYDVVTCGYGGQPPGVATHVQVPDAFPIWRYPRRLLILRRYRAAYWHNAAVAYVFNALGGEQFDVVLANDVDAVGLALELSPSCGVHVDLHEYASRQQDSRRFRWFVRPFIEWMCRRYVSRASSWTTVSGGLAREYEREFGFAPLLVTNAAPYQDLAPVPVRRPIRLVHSGAGLRNRNLMLMAEAVEASENDVTLDFYLTPNNPNYLAELKEFAAHSERVRVHDPVPYRDLITTLNRYDVGLFVLPPVNFNYAWALPNKLFDFIQARLGIVVGPSPEMAAYVREHALGVVSDDFTVDATRRSIDSLTTKSVEAFKQRAHSSACPLSSEAQVLVWKQCVDRLACL